MYTQHRALNPHQFSIDPSIVVNQILEQPSIGNADQARCFEIVEPFTRPNIDAPAQLRIVPPTELKPRNRPVVTADVADDTAFRGRVIWPAAHSSGHSMRLVRRAAT